MSEVWSADRLAQQNEQDYESMRDLKKANAAFFRVMKAMEGRLPETVHEEDGPQPSINHSKPANQGSRNHSNGGRDSRGGQGGSGNRGPQSSGGAPQARRTHGGPSGASQ